MVLLKSASKEDINYFSYKMFECHQNFRPDVFQDLESVSKYDTYINKCIYINTGELIGFLSYTLEGDYVFIKRIFIIEKYRRNYWGSVAIETLISEIGYDKEINIKTYTLAGYKLFERIGLSVYGIGSKGCIYMKGKTNLYN